MLTRTSLDFYDFFEKNIIAALNVRTLYNLMIYNTFFINLVPFESDPIDPLLDQPYLWFTKKPHYLIIFII